MDKMPPVEKIYEAYSAIADGRVVMENEAARVVSSEHTKVYTVKWTDGIYYSNDSASYWQGYAGYPIIAVLMLQGKLKFDRSTADFFKGIDWKELNIRYKSKYDQAAKEVFNAMKAKGVDINEVRERAEEIYRQLESLDITIKRNPENIMKWEKEGEEY